MKFTNFYFNVIGITSDRKSWFFQQSIEMIWKFYSWITKISTILNKHRIIRINISMGFENYRPAQKQMGQIQSKCSQLPLKWLTMILDS